MVLVQATLIFFFFFFGTCDSYSRLRQDVMVCPRGRMGCARASAPARGELLRVRALPSFLSSSANKQLDMHALQLQSYIPVFLSL